MQLVGDLPVPEPHPDEVRERADAIMARAEFNEPEPLLDRLGRWLDTAMSEVFEVLSGGGAGSIIAWILLGVFVAALVYLLMRLRPPSGLVSPATMRVSVQTVGPAATEHKTEADWRAAAERLAAEGRYDEAVRARYRALLARLIGRGLLEDIPGRTPGEYRREFAVAAPPAAAPFTELTDQFELVWYGPEHADEHDVVVFGELEERVLVGAGA